MSLLKAGGGIASKVIGSTLIVGVAGGATVYAVVSANKDVPKPPTAPSQSTAKKFEQKDDGLGERDSSEKKEESKKEPYKPSPPKRVHVESDGSGSFREVAENSVPEDLSVPEGQRVGEEPAEAVDTGITDTSYVPTEDAPVEAENASAVEEEVPVPETPYAPTEPPVAKAPAPTETPYVPTVPADEPPVAEEDTPDVTPPVEVPDTPGDIDDVPEAPDDVEDAPDAPETPGDTPEAPGEDVEDDTPGDIFDEEGDILNKKLAIAILEENSAKQDLDQARADLKLHTQERDAARKAYENAQQKRKNAEVALENAKKGDTSSAEAKVAEKQESLKSALDREAKARKAYDTAAQNHDEAVKKVAEKQKKYDEAQAKFEKDSKSGKFSWDSLSVASKEKLMGYMMMERINEYRSQAGLPELPTTEQMMQDAHFWSGVQAKEGAIRHPNVLSEYYGVIRLGSENVLYNWETDPVKAVERGFLQWKKSAGHNANMLSNNKSAASAGVVFGKDGRVYMTYRQYYAPNFINNAYKPSDVFYVNSTQGITGTDIREGVTYSGSQLSVNKLFYKNLGGPSKDALSPGEYSGGANADSSARDAAKKELDSAKSEARTTESTKRTAEDALNKAHEDVEKARAELDAEKNSLKDVENGNVEAVKSAEKDLKDAQSKEDTAKDNLDKKEKSVADSEGKVRDSEKKASEKTAEREGVEKEIKEHNESKKKEKEAAENAPKESPEKESPAPKAESSSPEGDNKAETPVEKDAVESPADTKQEDSDTPDNSVEFESVIDRASTPSAEDELVPVG